MEFAPFEPPDVDADLVILAGDTDIGLRGVRWAKRAFGERPVVYVLGNHEYYRNSLPQLTEKLRLEAEGSNVHVLERDVLNIGELTIFGCTLWTDLALNDDPVMGGRAVADLMNDYRLIRVSPQYRRLRPQDTESLHHGAVRWLRLEMPKHSKTSIVVTHHAPSAQSLGSHHVDDPANIAYASNLEDLIRDLSPSLWIHGHIHLPCDYRVGSTRVICNARGYAGEELHDFDPAFVLELE
jgi:predicted phosphohydrolase